MTVREFTNVILCKSTDIEMRENGEEMLTLELRALDFLKDEILNKEVESVSIRAEQYIVINVK